MSASTAASERRSLRARLAGPRVRTAISLIAVLVIAGVMFRPVSNNLVLYSGFLLLGGLAVLCIWSKRPRIPVEMYVIAYGVLALAIYGIAIGPSNPGLPYTILIWVLSPALWWLVAASANMRAVRWFYTAAAAVTLALCLLFLGFVAGESGAVPQLVPSFVADQLGLGATFSGGVPRARMYGLSSLVALGPMWVASLFLRRDVNLPPFLIRLACAILASIAAVASSRTAIVAVIAAAPFILLGALLVIGVRPAEPHRFKPAVVGATVIGAAGALSAGAYLLRNMEGWGPLTSTIDSFRSLFSGAATYDTADQSIRADQITHLIDAWSRFPIFGAGFGARVPDYPRTSERPWVLELQYHVLAYHIGIIGLLALIALLVVGLVLVRRATARAPQFRSTLLVSVVTAVAMIIANASNPYLQAPGHMWAIFLPLAVACAALRLEADATRPRPTGEAGPVWEDRS